MYSIYVSNTYSCYTLGSIHIERVYITTLTGTALHQCSQHQMGVSYMKPWQQLENYVNTKQCGQVEGATKRSCLPDYTS